MFSASPLMLYIRFVDVILAFCLHKKKKFPPNIDASSKVLAASPNPLPTPGSFDKTATLARAPE